MRRLPNLTALRAFEAAARHESLTRAAEELNVAHPALSRQIKELEAWLGCALFHRHNRGLSLTDAGRAYRDAASQAFDLIDAATGMLRPNAPLVGEQRLTLSVEPSFAQRWLVPRLGAFRAAHPAVNVIVDATREAADFRRGGADLGIRYGSGPWPGLESRKLADLENFPVCAPSLTPMPTQPADLLDTDLLLEEMDLPWQSWFAAVGITLNRPLRGTRFFDASHAMDVAVRGQGVALGDMILSRDDLAAGRLIRPFPQTAIYQSYSLVAPSAHFRRPAVKAFSDWALAAMTEFLRG
jgi:LysR family glycine cleavage system transcriptional activator